MDASGLQIRFTDEQLAVLIRLEERIAALEAIVQRLQRAAEQRALVLEPSVNATIAGMPVVDVDGSQPVDEWTLQRMFA